MDHYESDSDDVDESLTVPHGPHNADDDPLVEYVDELGRTRTVPRSQVPRDVPTSMNEEGEVPGYVHRAFSRRRLSVNVSFPF